MAIDYKQGDLFTNTGVVQSITSRMASSRVILGTVPGLPIKNPQSVSYYYIVDL